MCITSFISSLKTKHPKAYKYCHFLWHNVWLACWFYFILAILIIIARWTPNFARADGIIKGEYSIGYGAVAVIFFGSGLSMKTKDLLHNAFHWRAHLVVLSLQFHITSSIIYDFACAIKAARNPNISLWMLAGIIVSSCCPTTVSSNVVMTQKADGNVYLTPCEVFFGNMLDAFITSPMVQVYIRGSWSFANPANGTSFGHVFAGVMKQIGCSVFIPLFVGQLIQNVLPKIAQKVSTILKNCKSGSVMLLLIMFSSFSTAFYQNLLNDVSHTSIIMLCFFNFETYMLFTVI